MILKIIIIDRVEKVDESNKINKYKKIILL